MSRDELSDDFIPGFMLEPLRGYEDLGDILDPVTGRLIGRFGEKGMTIEEATRSATLWWDKTGRKEMPDYNKSAEYIGNFGMKSGILLGLPWAQLNRGERIRVISVWHHEIGLPQGLGITTEKELENVLIQQKQRAFNLDNIIGGNPADRGADGTVRTH